jgi:hypothetical protein
LVIGQQTLDSVDLRLVWNPDHLGGTAAAKGRKLFPSSLMIRTNKLECARIFEIPGVNFTNIF